MRICLAFLGSAILLLLPAAAWSHEAGDQVIVISQEHGIRISANDTEEVALGEPLTVLEVRGNRLKVSRDQSGWIPAADVIALDQALEHFAELIEATPEDVALYAARANVQYTLGNPEAAIADYDAAIRLDSRAANLFHNRGTIYLAMGDFQEALRDYDRAVDLESTDFRLYRSRGELYRTVGQHEQAIREYDESLRLNPASAVTYNVRGYEHLILAHYEQAIADFEEAISLNPDYPGPLNYLAWLLATCPVEEYRDGERAVELSTRLCELNSWENASDLDTLAAACAEAGNFEEAVQYQRQAIEMLEPGVSPRDFQQRLALYRRGQPYHDPPSGAEE